MKDTDIIAAIAPDAVSLMDKAIAEIKRLRQENATLTAERDEMQGELRKAETESSMLRVECGVIAAERDEARREVCAHEADTVEDQREYAAQRGWDCFPLSEEHTTISYKETP